MLTAVIGELFREGVHRVFARCDPRNECSRRLLEKAGMRRKAHLRQNIFFIGDAEGNPVRKDTYVYALLKGGNNFRNPLDKRSVP